MNTLPEKITSRLYKMTSGVSANDLRFHYVELSSAFAALDQQTHVALLDWTDVFADTQDSRELGNLFNQYGSDKAAKHNYHLIYAALLSRDAPLNILEIGMGTNNPSVSSSMGGTGHPGAAERALRDWAPKANVYGADIDKDILFTEERIQTFFVDQTKPETLRDLAAHLPKLDLVIDDGLHFPRANMHTINFALPLLREGGAVVVEDIVPQFYPIWRVAASVLSRQYECKFVKMKSEAVLIIKASAPQ